MNVSHIIDAKGSDVITAQPHCTLAEAAATLSERGIGAIVITGVNGNVLGIISERDVVRAISRHGAAALEDAVTKHMTGTVVTATRATTIDSLTEQMTAGRFRHMPVVEGGQLCGIVSIGDAVKWRVEQIESEHKALREYIASA